MDELTERIKLFKGSQVRAEELGNKTSGFAGQAPRMGLHQRSLPRVNNAFLG